MTGTIKSGNPTFFTETASTTSSGTQTKNFTVSGSGYVVASISIYSDSTNDYGTTRAAIYKNSALFAVTSTRSNTATNNRLGANACIGFPVSDGDTIGTELVCTKDGSKELYRNFLCFGCTVTAQ